MTTNAVHTQAGVNNNTHAQQNDRADHPDVITEVKAKKKKKRGKKGKKKNAQLSVDAQNGGGHTSPPKQ
jgi:hypothetical protein